MDFLFAAPEKTDRENLTQGDLLARNAGLRDALMQAHQYYASAPDYSHFVVLTQSCDIVRRSGKCKTRYITLAAARPLSVVTERFLAKISYSYAEFPITLCQKDQEIRAKQMLERLLHNTEDGLFSFGREVIRASLRIYAYFYRYPFQFAPIIMMLV
jgi:hypothetical protein